MSNPVQSGYQQAASQAAALDSSVEKIKDKAPVKFGVPSDQQGQSDFPGYYHTQTPGADQRMAYRVAAAQGTADPRATGLDRASAQALAGMKVNLTSQDVNWLEQRRQEKEQLAFDHWAKTNVDLANPNTARFFNSAYPSYLARREKFIDDQLNVAARAAKIRLRGWKNREDLTFLWAVDSGRIRLPTESVWRLGDATAPGVPGADYQSGMFNPFGRTARVNEFKNAGGWKRDEFGPGGAGFAFGGDELGVGDTYE